MVESRIAGLGAVPDESQEHTDRCDGERTDAPSLQAAMDNMAYPAYAAMARSEDAIEGPKAFAEKRKPAWKGR